MFIGFTLFFTAIFIDVTAVEDCEKLTREDQCLEVFENIDNCNDMTYRPQIMNCLVTCGKCDAFTCSNRQPDTVLNCTALISQCNSPKWERFMKEKCPSTCGKCDMKNAILCKDVADSSICSKLAKFCNSVEFYDNMSEQCASTCNRCPIDSNSKKSGSTCVDFAKDCATKKELCTNPSYDGLMHRACAKTCNKCNDCFDASMKCDSWMKRGFCTTSDLVTRKRYCAKTCKTCSTR